MCLAGWPRAEGPRGDCALFQREPNEALELSVTKDLHGLRQEVRDSGLLEQLTPERRSDLVLAISEAAANALRYDRPPRSLRLWGTPQEVVAEVSGQGRIDDPSAGRRHPSSHAVRGWGLWAIHQLCDRVEIDQDAESVLVRMHMHAR